MKITQKALFVLLFAGLTLVSAAVDNHPLSAGTTTGRNVTGSAPDATFQNPALLGCERVPQGGLLIAPITNYGFGLWSDKLAISPFTLLGNFPTDSANVNELLKKVIARSFGLTDNMSPDEQLGEIMKGIDGGARIYSGFRASLLSYAQKRIAVNVTTHVDEEVRLPEGALALPFEGVLLGKKLDFSNFRQEGIWATDVSLQVGLPVSIPVLHNMFKLRYGAGGLGLKYVMGHSLLRATTTPGSSLFIDPNDNNLIKTDAKFNVQTAGLGLYGPWEFDGPFKKGIPISGHGLGVDVGGILYDDNGAMSINVQNLGVLFWTNNVKQVEYKVENELDVYEIVRIIENNRNLPDDTTLQKLGLPTSTDTLSNAPAAIMTFLPLSLNIGYARTYDFTKFTDKRWKKVADYATVAANYEQQLAPGPGRSFIPRLSLGAELATLHNFVPLRAGIVMGGPEHWASAVGMGFNFRYFSIHGSYKGIGNWWLWPSRGFEVAGGININWGFDTDFDKDGIPDIADKCPNEPEDIDGFEDEDGCPDPDNDNDGILDVNDKCPDKPEDFDGFEDEDGCPDFDNDMDGIPDADDLCPDAPEDYDGFQDEDGCPDPDNDRDGVPDSIDRCPNDPEDIDGFEDEDGCPDFDNDQDGVPDTLDQCLNVPGVPSNNGCPEKKAEPVKPTVKEIQILNTKLRGVNFQTGGAELLPASFAALNYISSFLRQYPELRYEIQGHTDNVGEEDYNLLLSAARAGTVRAYLLSKGIPDSNLIAIGYGLGRPVATNKNARGRAKNRRVEFKYIESDAEYAMLKEQEAAFRERIRSAKIKGANY